MPSNSPAARAAINFHNAEHYYKRSLETGKSHEGVKTCREIACSCYVEGLKILNAEYERIEPLDYLRLCVQEQSILITYVLPSP